MATIGSQMIAGYFKTPTHLLAPIASLLQLGSGEEHSAVDPCAGDGEAITTIASALSKRCTVYACEMEATRYKALEKRLVMRHSSKELHGDAMRIAWSSQETYDSRAGASLLWLNPPYDQDREHKRLEERFLRRFVTCLCLDGVLVFIVPHYALAASADTIARHIAMPRCYRFPDPDFDGFKQVVLVGMRRQALASPDPEVRAQVMQWAASVDGMPVLGSETSVVTVPGHGNYKSGFAQWSMKALDLTTLLATAKPWHFTTRTGKAEPIVGIVPGKGDLLARRYPMAVPPKPGHLAAAIASGIFNGARIEATGLRPLRVKGVFQKDFKKLEDKHNKDGEKTGEVQVEKPSLVVTALDCNAGTYHTLRATAERSGTNDPALMTTGDLLVGYGTELMRVMREQCPVLHDPASDTDRFELPTFGRKPYRAQEEAIRATVKLLGGLDVSPAERRRLAVLLMGEIGSGKTGVFLCAAETIGAKRVLATCPPHLTQGWCDEARKVLPWARWRVLEDIGDVDDFCRDTDPRMSIGIMSRSAKLSHRWAGVTGGCPKCGGALPVADDGIPMSADELAAKRRRCGLKRTSEGKWVADGSQARDPKDKIARVAQRLAFMLMNVTPRSADVNQLCRGRIRDKLMIKHAAKHTKSDLAAWLRVRPQLVPLVKPIARKMLHSQEWLGALGPALLRLLAAINDSTVMLALVDRIYLATMFHPENYGFGDAARDWCRDALLLVADRGVCIERLKHTGLHAEPTMLYGQSASTWTRWSDRAASVDRGGDDPETYRTKISGRTVNKHPLGAVELAVEALAFLSEAGRWSTREPCGEHLYQAVPEPRKVSLTHYLARQHPKVVDLLAIDEGHELANGDSAQSVSEHRLVSLGMPVVMLTGSIMSGYAKSLFTNVWALGRHLRTELKRNEEARFCRTYGYVKQLVQMKDGQGNVVEWGSTSERKNTTAKEIGYAPGVLPVFLIKHLLENAVTIHKADLALDLPPCREIVEYIEPSPEILAPYQRMVKALKDQIKADRFGPLAGKLFGQMSEIGSYLDRATADTGNRHDGAYAVCYPVNEELGADSGRAIDEQAGLDPCVVSPKERWMLNKVRAELAEGRRVMVFGWHEAVLPRLQRLLERELNEPVAMLLSKVQAKKRQDWIDAHVVKKERRVLVLNPACVKTGLNNLVHFQTQVWMENPGCDPIIYRQAVGRVDRIGQEGGPQHEVRIFFPVYTGTLQAGMHKLLLHKVGVSMSVDGLDAESALQAAGVGDSDDFDAFSVGRALFELMDRGEGEERVVRPLLTPKPSNDAAPALPAANDTKPRTTRQLSLF